MKNTIKKSIIFFPFFLFFFLQGCSSQNIQTSNICVFDYEKILTHKEKEKLSKILVDYKKQNVKEIIIVTTNTIGNSSSALDYATNLGVIYSNEIKNENIVTVVISKKLKEIAIATSPKAKEKLSNDFTSYIINDKMIPKIKEGLIFESLELGIYEIIKKWGNG